MKYMKGKRDMTILDAELLKEYSIKRINSDDNELIKFLFSLGCYAGEEVKVVNRKRNSHVLSIKDSRYSIDANLAKAIHICQPDKQ